MASSREQEFRHNVVVFGEIGVGKSSLINMIADSPVAETSPNALSSTSMSRSHDVTLHNKHIRLWDTAGLKEGKMSEAVTKKAIIHLYQLVKGLEDGVSLLVLCMRAPDVRSNRDYKMFYEGLCQGKVPIVLVVTGLEGEHRMDDWWERNKGFIKGLPMSFDGHACITATRGKLRDGKHQFEDEYQQSKEKVQKLVSECCSQEAQRTERTRAGTMDIAKVWINIGARILRIPPLVLRRDLYDVLVKQGGYPEKDARKIAGDAETLSRANGWNSPNTTPQKDELPFSE